MLPEFSITAGHLPDIHVLAPGELDVVSADGVADALVETAASPVVADLSGLMFMDSSGIAALVGPRNRIVAKGPGQLDVARSDAIARKTSEIEGLRPWIVDRGSWIVEWLPA